MIKHLWEYGSVSALKGVPPKYNIAIIFDNGERKDFSGYEPEEVKNDAMDYIVKHYWVENGPNLSNINSTINN